MKERAERRLIVLIHGGSAVDQQTLALNRSRFAYFGYEMDDVSMTAANARERLRHIVRHRGRDLAFFFSSNFWALNASRDGKLLHMLTGVPLVVFLQDHPLYYRHLATPALDGTITFAPGRDAADFVRKYYPYRTNVVANTSGATIGLDAPSAPPDRDDFHRRRNELLCPMNLSVAGETLDHAWAAIKGFPAVRRLRAQRIIDAALTDCLTPLHLIAEQIDETRASDLVDDLLPILNLVKLWRRTRVVEMLIDLPVLFSTDYVPATLELRHPGKFTQLSVAETVTRYRTYRFVVNSNPLLNDTLHDRVDQALHNNCVCVTDRNTLLEEKFSADDMLFIDFDRDDNAARVGSLLDDEDRAFEMTMHCRQAWTQTTYSVASYDDLFAAVDSARDNGGYAQC